MTNASEAASARHKEAVRSTIRKILSVKDLAEAMQAAADFDAQPDSVSLEVARRISFVRSTGRLSSEQKQALELMTQWVQTRESEVPSRRRVGLQRGEEPQES